MKNNTLWNSIKSVYTAYILLGGYIEKKKKRFFDTIVIFNSESYNEIGGVHQNKEKFNVCDY